MRRGVHIRESTVYMSRSLDLEEKSRLCEVVMEGALAVLISLLMVMAVGLLAVRRRPFDAEIIELCVRWCITYRLSY